MTDHDFFARTEDKLLAGMRRGAHMPWPARARRRVRSLNRRSQALGIVIIALVVAAPAVAAVSGWFAVGEPLSAGRPTPNASSGSVTPQGAHMFALRFDDPAEGPKWGLRQVLTTRGDVCLQVGRVERDQIGSIGINGLWHDDHEFHETPPGALYGDDVTCEPPLKGRYAYFEAYDLGDNASAMAGWTNGCRVSANNGSALKPVCPAGTNRMVYYGLLGPDAQTITYTTPNGRTATEHTDGSQGAYLLVFRRTPANCLRYIGENSRIPGECNGDGGSALLGGIGPITKVTYRDGSSCEPARTTSCPDVGPPATPLHALKVSSPIHIHESPGTGSLISVTFTAEARAKVTSSSSWYLWRLRSLAGSACSTTDQGIETSRDIAAGTTLRYSTTLPRSCKGTYKISLTYDRLALPPNDGGAKESTGILTVGTRRFRTP